MKNRNYRGTIVITFVIMAILFTSCHKNIKETSKTPSELFVKNSPVTVVMPKYTKYDPGSRENYAEELLRKQGFNINFEVFNTSASNNTQFRKLYMEYCEQKLSSGGNVICIVRDTSVEGLVSKGLIKDITNDYIGIAPKQYEEFFGSEKQKVYGIPTDKEDTGKAPYRWAVLVKKEIADAYGQEIRTVNDYENFLKWADNKYTQYIPGLFPLLLYSSVYYTGFSPFDFFAPEYGYYPVGDAFSEDDSLMVYADSKDSSGEPDFYAAEALPVFREALLRLYGWQRNGLIEYRSYKNTYNRTYNTDSYASIVVNTADYSKNDLELYFPNRHARINAANYEMYILYPEQIPNTWDKGPVSYWRGVASANADPSIFIGFISWLNDSPENYEAFHFGVLNKDYKKDSDKITILDTDIDYPKWDQLRLFTNNNWRLRFSDEPSNWGNEMEKIKCPAIPLLQELKDNQADVKESLQQNPISKEYVQLRIKEYEDLFKLLYFENSNEPEALIDEFINNKSLQETGKYMVNRYKEILNNIN